MTTGNDTNAKPKERSPKKKSGAKASRKSKASVKKAATKPKGKAAAAPKATSGTSERLRPGELDGLVIAHLREKTDALPLGAGAVAKGIGRSSGAVGNCLERLAKSEKSQIRRVTEKPRTYDLDEGSQKTSS